MGLAEKRAIEELKKGQFAEVVKNIKDITKFDVDVVANWDDFATHMDGRSDDISRYFMEMFGTTMVESLKAICADDIGREALQGVLKKITFKCDSNASYSESGFSFANGEVVMNLTWSGNDIEPRTKAMISLLEKSL